MLREICQKDKPKVHSPGGASGKEPTCQCRRHEMWVQSLGQEDPLEEGMATNSNILAWRNPWTEEAGGLQSTGSQRVGHNFARVHSAQDAVWVKVYYFFWHMNVQIFEHHLMKRLSFSYLEPVCCSMSISNCCFLTCI